MFLASARAQRLAVVRRRPTTTSVRLAAAATTTTATPKMAAETTAAEFAKMAANPLGKGAEAPSLDGTSAASPVVFLTTHSCPYAQRTWLALEEAGVPYRPVFVDLQDKAEFHLAWNPYGRVPTLAWASSASGNSAAASSLYESLICDEFVNDVSGGKLLPADGGPAAAAGARLLIDQFFQKLGPAFAGLLFSEDGGEKAREAAAKADEALAFLEANTAAGPGAEQPLSPPSSGPAPLFLLGGNGGNFTLADAAIYPFLARLNRALPGLAPKSAGKYADLAACGYPKVAAWLARTAARPGVRRTEVAPEGTDGYWESMHATYVAYQARTRAAMAAAK